MGWWWVLRGLDLWHGVLLLLQRVQQLWICPQQSGVGKGRGGEGGGGVDGGV